jgi:dolichol-phosphate mannosyltransferase
MNSPRVLVALATYNEIHNLPSLVEEIRRVLPEADVLVVDDNSPDGTGRWCDERAQRDERVKCLHRRGKLGLGSATLAAMRAAIEGGYELLVTMDADWSHDPEHLPALVDATEHADVAVGSRYCAEGRIDGWPLHRRILSRAVNRLSRALLRLPVRDASGAFRVYRVSALKRIDLSQIHSSGYSYLEEVLWLLRNAGCRFHEAPITFHPRRTGYSKIGLREALGKLGTLLRLAFAKRPDAD